VYARETTLPAEHRVGRWPVWSCLAGCHDHDGFLDDTTKPRAEQRRYYTRLLSTLSPNTIDAFSTAQLRSGWHKIVEDYSTTGLSFEADRLPAIGGIASLVSPLIGVEYVAGLWKDNLLQDLMWTCIPGEWSRRAESWRAPTWSWASVNGTVQYRSITKDAMPTARVLDCKSLPQTGAASGFGMVAEGTLSIQGSISEIDQDAVLAIMQEQGMASSPPRSNIMADWEQLTAEFMRTMPLWQGNSALDLLPSGELYVFLTFERSWYVKFEATIRDKCFSTLILHRISEDKYERVGAFANSPAKASVLANMSWEEKTVTIV
jgi:hypothetical protein